MSTISTWAVLCLDFEVTSLYTHQFLCQLWKIWTERFLSSLLWIQITDCLLFPSMPDVSDVGAPAKGPGLPYRVPEAPPPPVRVKIEHGWDPSHVSNLVIYQCQCCRSNVEIATTIYDEIQRNVPGAIVDTFVGDPGKNTFDLNDQFAISLYSNKDPNAI